MLIKDEINTTLYPSGSIEYSLLLPPKCKSTLIWLHGYGERARYILRHPIFEEFSRKLGTAIIFPDVPDVYYLNQPWRNCYTEDFIVKELIPQAAKKHGLPKDREQLFLGGLSMGGFGALLIGAHNPGLFGKIAAVSGAFIIDDLLIGNPAVVGSSASIQHFRNIFGDIPSLEQDEARNPLRAVEAMKDKSVLPPIYLCCGRDDLLYDRNIKLLNKLREMGVDVSWHEDSGTHDWNYFDKAIALALDWLLRDSTENKEGTS